jgi:hypothetical protein
MLGFALLDKGLLLIIDKREHGISQEIERGVIQPRLGQVMIAFPLICIYPFFSFLGGRAPLIFN